MHTPIHTHNPGDVAPEKGAFAARTLSESLVLNRDVRLVLQGVDRNNCLFAEVKYSNGSNEPQDLAQQLVQQGLAKVCWGGVGDSTNIHVMLTPSM